MVLKIWYKSQEKVKESIFFLKSIQTADNLQLGHWQKSIL